MKRFTNGADSKEFKVNSLSRIPSPSMGTMTIQGAKACFSFAEVFVSSPAPFLVVDVSIASLSVNVLQVQLPKHIGFTVAIRIDGHGHSDGDLFRDLAIAMGREQGDRVEL